jgi:hypothetical protein
MTLDTEHGGSINKAKNPRLRIATDPGIVGAKPNKSSISYGSTTKTILLRTETEELRLWLYSWFPA